MGGTPTWHDMALTKLGARLSWAPRGLHVSLRLAGWCNNDPTFTPEGERSSLMGSFDGAPELVPGARVSPLPVAPRKSPCNNRMWITIVGMPGLP